MSAVAASHSCSCLPGCRTRPPAWQPVPSPAAERSLSGVSAEAARLRSLSGPNAGSWPLLPAGLPEPPGGASSCGLMSCACLATGSISMQLDGL